MQTGAEKDGCDCGKVYGDSMGISSYIFTYVQCSMVGLWPIYEAKGQVEAQHLPDGPKNWVGVLKATIETQVPLRIFQGP